MFLFSLVVYKCNDSWNKNAATDAHMNEYAVLQLLFTEEYIY
jgi:hypothetical protein